MKPYFLSIYYRTLHIASNMYFNFEILEHNGKDNLATTY